MRLLFPSAILAALLIVVVHGTLITGPPGRVGDLACKAVSVSVWPVVNFDGRLGIVASGPVGYVNSPPDGAVDLNKAIVLRDSGWRAFDVIDEILRFQAQNASAVVLMSATDEAGRIVWTLRERVDHVAGLQAMLKIPVFQVSIVDCAKTFQLASNISNALVAQLTTVEMANPYFVELTASWIAGIQILFLFFPIIGICVVLLRLVVRLWHDGFVPNLSFSILVLEFVAHSLRLAFAVDPLGMLSIYDPFNANFWFTPHMAAGLICHFSILIYWNLAMRSFGSRSIQFLSKYLYGLFAFIVLLEIATSVCRSFEIAYELVVFTHLFYVVLMAVMVLYALVTSIQFSRFLKVSKLNAKQHRAKEKVVKVSRLILTCSVFLCIVMLFSGFGFAPWFRHPTSEVAYWWLMMSLMTSIGIIETLVLRSARNVRRLPTIHYSSSSSSNSTTSRTSRSIRSRSQSERSERSFSQHSASVASVGVPKDHIVESSSTNSGEAADSSVSSTAPLPSPSSSQGESENEVERATSAEV